MSRMKVARRDIGALLEHLRDRQNCPNGCDCIFCHEWELGYAAGKEEAAKEIQRSLQQFLKAGA